MKRHTLKSLAGVTLLEIMLVLAIAAMIIVMSVKYYQTATASQQTNSALQSIQSVTAASDSIAQGTGTYSNATSTNIISIAGPNSLLLPWGGSIAVTGGNATSYIVTLSATPAAVCNSLTFKLKANTHFTGLTACPAAGTTGPFSYTYST